MARVFLSYKRKERDRVRAVVSALEAKGHKVWWDPHLDPRDAAYQIQIKREIDASQACIVVWSKLSAESDFVVSEAEMARAQGKLVCILLDHDCTPPPPFNTMQLIDLSDWHGDAGHVEWRRVLGAVKEPSATFVARHLMGTFRAKQKAKPSKLGPLMRGVFSGLVIATAIIAVPVALLFAYVKYNEHRYLGSEEGYAYQATFPTEWKLIAYGEEVVISNFKEVLGRPLTSARPEEELRDGERLIGSVGFANAVRSDIQWPGRLFRPTFEALRWDRLAFECKLRTRIIEFDSTDDLYRSHIGVPWDAGTPAEEVTQFVFVNFRTSKWSSSTARAIPTDEDGNGVVWEAIEAGTGEFLCFDVMRIAGQNYRPGSYSCRNELDLTTLQRRTLAHPQLRLDYLNTSGRHPEIDNAGYATPRSLLPGQATISVGSCRRMEVDSAVFP